jgi:hypothetical protein
MFRIIVAKIVAQSPLSGVKRTWRLRCEMSAYDRERTSEAEISSTEHFPLVDQIAVCVAF